MTIINEKIFCIGFPKTGTTSLESSLIKLGYNVCRGDWRNNHTNYLIALYVNHDFDELFKVIRYFDAFTDLPWGGSDLYIKIAEQHPDAKFILTIRDPESWYRSLCNAALEVDSEPATALETYHAMGGYGAVYFMSRVWGVDTLEGSKEKLIQYFIRHNEAVIEYFRDDPRILILDITTNPGWADLCNFLGKSVPENSFPHENPGSKTR